MRRQSAVETPRHPTTDPISERQQILESILRTTRWPTTFNVAALEETSAEGFANPTPLTLPSSESPDQVRVFAVIGSDPVVTNN